jgi:hypothetical protein
VRHVVPVDLDGEVAVAPVARGAPDREELVVVHQPCLGPEHGGPCRPNDVGDDQLEGADPGYRSDRRDPYRVGVDGRQRDRRQGGRSTVAPRAAQRSRTAPEAGDERRTTEPEDRPSRRGGVHPRR